MEANNEPQQPRVPNINPITFSALSALDGFLARAPLTRQEHAQAQQNLQHILQTVELLEAKVKHLESDRMEA